jgi:hypothetical protein
MANNISFLAYSIVIMTFEWGRLPSIEGITNIGKKGPI